MLSGLFIKKGNCFMLNTFSSIRFTSLALAAVVASLVVSGCGKKAAESASSAPETTPAVTSPDLFTKPIGSGLPDPSTVLAVVNGTDITLGQFNKEMDVMMNRMQGRVPPERLGQMRMQMRDQLLDNMITRQVLIDQVKSADVTIDDEEFKKAVDELTATLPAGVTLTDMLAQAQTTEEEFKSTLTTELKIRKLIEAQTGKPEPASEEEIETFYKENQEQFERPETVSASHILIGTEPTDSEEVKQAKHKEAEEVRKQLLEGADFAQMAAEHSSCPSKAQGGNLGRFPRGRMVPEFEEAAFTQNVGEIGEIVETQFGYHVIKVDERDEAGITPLEEVKEQLGTYLANQKQQKSVQAYIETLREKASVSFPGGAPAEGAATTAN